MLTFEPLFTPFPNILGMTNYIFFEPLWQSVNLSLFSSKSDHLENLTPVQKVNDLFLFCPYLDNATSYGYHVIYFFTAYNKRNNMTYITTKLKHFEFCNA